jgi:hypothetical protein
LDIQVGVASVHRFPSITHGGLLTSLAMAWNPTFLKTGGDKLAVAVSVTGVTART